MPFEWWRFLSKEIVWPRYSGLGHPATTPIHCGGWHTQQQLLLKLLFLILSKAELLMRSLATAWGYCLWWSLLEIPQVPCLSSSGVELGPSNPNPHACVPGPWIARALVGSRTLFCWKRTYVLSWAVGLTGLQRPGESSWTTRRLQVVVSLLQANASQLGMCLQIILPLFRAERVTH